MTLKLGATTINGAFLGSTAISRGYFGATEVFTSGGSVFSPADLFAAGEVGAWYDPSDLATLFQDSAGTIPVTSAGQSVGKVLDKSGRGNHATQPTSSKRPTYQAAAGLSWLEFDGVDDTMVTGTITPGVDKAQAFVGLLKISSVADIVLETSENAGGNNGALYVVAGEDAQSRYSTMAGGTGGATAGNRVAKIIATSTYPEKTVLTSTADIAADLVRMAKNGVYGTDATADLGSGNFLAHQLNIGSRNQTSLFLEGNIYGLILRFGANLTDAQIADTESYIEGKTGVPL